VLVLVAFLTAMGAHWFLLQSVAWTTMLAVNLRSTSLPAAVERTFDGKHPCALCKQICKGKQTEKKSEFRVEPTKFEFSYSAGAFVFIPPAQFWVITSPDLSATFSSDPPLLPPPRALLG